MTPLLPLLIRARRHVHVSLAKHYITPPSNYYHPSESCGTESPNQTRVGFDVYPLFWSVITDLSIDQFNIFPLLPYGPNTDTRRLL